MEIKEYREINKGCLKSAFTLCIPEWGNQEIDCCYFEKDNGSFWINAASKEYTNRDGQKKSYNMVRWDEKTTAALNKAVREKIKTDQVQHKVSKNYYTDDQLAIDNSDLPF